MAFSDLSAQLDEVFRSLERLRGDFDGLPTAKDVGQRSGPSAHAAERFMWALGQKVDEAAQTTDAMRKELAGMDADIRAAVTAMHGMDDDAKAAADTIIETLDEVQSSVAPVPAPSGVASAPHTAAMRGQE